jgi:creatinine amidohydrolase
MSVHYWHEASRSELAEVLPEALVVIPVGALAQHGPHLPTGTDTLIVRTVVDLAVEQVAARSERPLVVVPALSFGASDHHLPFGGTLSLSAATLSSVLVDLVASVSRSGGRRILFVNAHEGNSHPCGTAAAIAADRHGVAAAHTDYWDLFERPVLGGPAVYPPVPGHAGEFETSLVLALYPDLVAAAPRGTGAGPGVVAAPGDPITDTVPGMAVHDPELWRELDGWTDDPSRADPDQGKLWLQNCADALADRITDLTTVWWT